MDGGHPKRYRKMANCGGMCVTDPKWQPGDLRQACNGRFAATGTSLGPPVAAVILILFGCSLFFAFPARYLLWEMNDPAAMVLGAILGFVSLSSFLITATTDPGVIPPATPGPYMIHEMRPLRTQNALTNQGRVTLKYCDMCNIYRPPRAEHCPHCRNCVLKFDHRTCALIIISEQ